MNSSTRIRPLRTAFGIIRRDRRAYLALNLAFYGVLVLAAVAAGAFPWLREAAQHGTDPNADPTNHLFVATYGTGDVLGAAGITFVVNLLIGALLWQTAPSLVVPFAGVALGLVRLVGWGMIFTPSGADDLAWFVPHGVTALLEAQGYVLAALASWVHGRKFLRPRRFGLETRRAGYAAGLADALRLYPLVVVVLAVAALWEAVELIHLVPDEFLQWWLGR
ncbi:MULTISPECIES: hypothetical protein [Actinosynnema]|uniref:hypothetical protein n=1 Tax=Actinosynnema TaxID=40566 RepID=UPI0020A2AF24|nr:hypothetical protein [Actinosynnema pretiosum]MCP2098858.1 hypothetical protein [Actinosynnema pretiosum]